MATDLTTIGIRIEASGGTAAAAEIAKTGVAAGQANTSFIRLGESAKTTTAATNTMARGFALASQQVDPFQRGLRALALQQVTASTAVTTGAAASTAGMTRLTSAFGQLAIGAIGARSAVGGLVTGGLMTLGVTTGVILGVVAAAAAVAYGYDKLTKSARESAAALKAVREELAKKLETPQTVAAGRVSVLDAAVKKAEADLAKAQRPQSIPTGAGGAVDFVDDQAVAKAQALLKALRDDLAQAKREATGADRQAADAALAQLAKGIELRTASAAQIRQAIALMAQEKAASENLSTGLDERNAAAERYNTLQQAFATNAKAVEEARKALLEQLRDEVDVFQQLADSHRLQLTDLPRLRTLEGELDEAVKAKNTTTRERIQLEKELARAVALRQQLEGTELADNVAFRDETLVTGSAATSTDGPAPAPSANILGGARSAGGPNLLGNSPLTEQLLAESDALRTTLADSLAQSLVGGIEDGFGALFASGSIGQGFAGMATSLLAGLGSAMVQFGKASLITATLMEKIKKGLASFLPGGAIAASIAMIAIGSAMGAVANSAAQSFGDGGGGGSRGGGIRREDQVVSGVVTPTAVRSSGRVQPPTPLTVNANFIGIDDPKAQTAVYEMFERARARRV